MMIAIRSVCRLQNLQDIHYARDDLVRSLGNSLSVFGAHRIWLAWTQIILQCNNAQRSIALYWWKSWQLWMLFIEKS